MTFDEVLELHNITHIQNLPSILEHGIVSHQRAMRLMHESVAMQEIQDRRSSVVLPNGRKLHTYANLYVNARNKMMFKIRERHRELCVIRIDRSVLLEPGIVVSDQNAASDRVRFGAGVDGLKRIDREYIFAQYWNHPEDQIESWRHGSAMCCEVLVPDRLPPHFILGVYVSGADSANELRERFPDLDVVVNGNLFFR